MLVDLLNSGNQVSYNTIIAQTIGLHPAIYLSELLTITAKALHKNKLQNNYFMLDRAYITDRTTFSIDEQLGIDKMLISLGILVRDDFNPDMLQLNIETLAGLLGSEEPDVIKRVHKISEYKPVKRASGNGKTKRENIMEGMKRFIYAENPELIQAYNDWIDGVCANPKGFLSKKSVEAFQSAIDNYAQGNLDLALALINIAAINGYRDATWAYNRYMSDRKVNFKLQPTCVQPTTHAVELSDEVF